MLKDILVPLVGSAADAVAINVAADLAEPHGAHVRIVRIADLPPPMPGPWDLIPPAAIVDAQDAVRAKAAKQAERIRERFASHSKVEVKVVEAHIEYPGDLAAAMAYTADLTVIGGWSGTSKPEPMAVRYFNALLFSSGRPILVVPPRCKTPSPPSCVVVGWTPTPHSCRALHDAIPLLQRAHTVELVQIDTVADDRYADSQLIEELIAHLGRHSVTARLVSLQSRGHQRSGVLLDHAKQVKAGMLVVGGYGHSRLREWSIGGMTRELLSEATLPVLYAH